MIHVAPISGGAAAVEYYTADNYYTSDQSLDTSEWFGKGAEALGLRGSVDKDTFAAVIEGRLPDGSVIQGKDGHHRPGDEIHFSVSKSVSLMALVGGDKRLIEAFKEFGECRSALGRKERRGGARLEQRNRRRCARAYRKPSDRGVSARCEPKP